MRKTHAFDVGDIVKGPSSSYHELITKVLSEPATYASIVLETGVVLEKHNMPSSWFHKVS
jgi:hypothetical protein